MLRLLAACAVVTFACYAASTDPKAQGQMPVQSCYQLAGQLLQTNQALHKKVRDCSVELTQLKSSIACKGKGSLSFGGSLVPAKSCDEVHKYRNDAPSGVYYIRSAAGVKVEQVYCHMNGLGSCGGGGWTTLMKVDGRKTTFEYRSSHWTHNDVYNTVGGRYGFDDKETKLNTYNSMPFKKLCVVFKNPSSGQTSHVLITKTAKSLLSIIQPNKFVPVSVPKSTWLRSIHGAALQPYCNRNGFNAADDLKQHAHVRIGIISNNENNCQSSDSSLGVGTNWECGKVSAGNVYGCGGGRPAYFAYILAQ